MSDTSFPAVDAVIAAFRDGTDERREGAIEFFADDVGVFSAFGVGVGRDAAVAALANPRVLGILSGATFSVPHVDGDAVHVTAAVAPGLPVGGFEFGFVLDADGRIVRFEQDTIPGAPREPDALVLTDAHAELLDTAMANGTVPIVAYVGADGVPKLSYRATVQVLDGERLAIWIRDANGGLVRALPSNPNVSIWYGDRAGGVTLQFVGRAHVDDTDEVRDRVYDGSVKAERDMDWRKRGVAVVVDVDRVEGRDSTGQVLMAR
ncbi:MAG: pyridoxamine 5'-phosphate oxidase family protein [Acidimicrobiia bacterium]